MIAYKMAHLSNIRSGWESEHLAAFLLSKIAFIASPVKIGDDIGIDFYCTYFKELSSDGRKYLTPKNSFAIQIRSIGRIIKDNYSVDVTNKKDYFISLELPYFIGIVDQNKSNLTIYSGEYLPLFVHWVNFDKVKSVKLKLCVDYNFSKEDFSDPNKEEYMLMCPKIATFSTAMSKNEIDEEKKYLIATIIKTYKNISSIVNHEYIFKLGVNDDGIVILAGGVSVENFRNNFKYRLAEVFNNLEWIFGCQNNKFNINEFKFYEDIINKMIDVEGSIPDYLSESYNKIKEKLNNL